LPGVVRDGTGCPRSGFTGGRYQNRGRSRRLSLRGPPMGLPSRRLGEGVGAEQARR
jgi:hypothetical protein